MFNEKEVIVGLDISSSVIGVSFFDLKMELINLIAIEFKQEKLDSYQNFFNKISFFENEIGNVIDLNKYKVVEYRIEANAKAFSPNATTAHTLFTLAKMNAMVCLSMWKKFPQAKIKEIQVSSARKNIGFKQDKSKKTKVKEQVFDFIISNKKEILSYLPKKVLKSGQNKGKEVYKECAKDMVDAYVIAKGAGNGKI